MKMMKKTLLAASVAAFASSAAMASISDGKVKIGVLADMGGVYADACGRGCVTAIQMAAEDFGGSVLGAPIEIVSADDQMKPDVGSAIVRKWIENEQVDAVGGLVTSSVVLAAIKVTSDAKKIALISTAASNAPTTSQCSPYNVHWTYNVEALANGTVKPMVEAGKKKWFFLTADYAFGHALESVATKVIKERGGRWLDTPVRPWVPPTSHPTFCRLNLRGRMYWHWRTPAPIRSTRSRRLPSLV